MKVLIIGNRLCGKTKLAKELSNYFNIDYCDLDNVNNVIKKEDYIVEGMYNNNYDYLIPKVSSIIFLDYDKKVLINRLKRKYLLHKINKNQYNEILDIINNYNSSFINNIMNKYPNKLIIIKTNKEIKKLFKALDERFEL